MPRLRILSMALALTTFAGVVAAPAPAAVKTKPKPTCKRSHSTTVAENRDARVFTRPGNDGGHTEGTNLLACFRKTGRVRLLDYAFDDDYVSSNAFALVRLRGQFAAFFSESTDISCKASCPPGYEATIRGLHLVDVRYGRGFSVKVAERPAGNRLLLDARGAMAWPRRLPANQVEVRVADAAGEHAVDSGAIRPESLTLTAGGRLWWVKDGTPHSALLDHGSV